MQKLDAYHYFEKRMGPFRNLSSLSVAEAEATSAQIRQAGQTFASQRSADYMTIRRSLEQMAYEKFTAASSMESDRSGGARALYRGTDLG
ncbi:hypothetical protein DFQ00_11165 [Paenibacillus barcinonensis]|uniref:Uncharacterized protein n=1 Tax=Paenibacillus barcinonensis TaxID=198119 RepID=A0A2V4WJX0_PAEBA|nr:hypothetical protein [Paenibacillus barcinonensis]PYE47766.1 hypothetical protein DFQ00_11165 [Paenibacillus barcinonensis]